MSVRVWMLAVACVMGLEGFSASASGGLGATTFHLTFEPGLAALSASARSVVVEAARAYGRGDTVRIELGADAAGNGTSAGRQALSGLRNMSVRRELRHLGLPYGDIGIGWLGPDDPLLPMPHVPRNGGFPRIRVMMPHP